MAKFSESEVLMGRATLHDLPTDLKQNLATLVARANALVAGYGKPLIVSSGYRPAAINASIANAGKNSWHMHCAALDVADPSGDFWIFVLANLQLCADLGLWVEDRRWTPTWVHLQIYPPASGKRIFVPSTKPAPAPKAFDGKYNTALDSRISKA